MSSAKSPDDDDSADGFLNRWSRRKREIATKETPAPELPTAPALPISAVDAEPAEAAQAELDELLARLPSLDSIGKDTDITGFLHALVPDALRNAALRAAWSADPGIRDFLNDARDYALDYTATGNAPGFGALGGTADDLKAMVGQIFGDAPVPVASEDKTLVAEVLPSDDEASDMESQAAIDALQHQIPAALATESVRRTYPSKNGTELTHKLADNLSDNDLAPHVALQQAQDDLSSIMSEITTFRRRGGSATPI
jgi:Protein of unknown function (DUF3306)